MTHADIIRIDHTILRVKFLYRYSQKNSKHCLRIYAGEIASTACGRPQTEFSQIFLRRKFVKIGLH